MVRIYVRLPPHCGLRFKSTTTTTAKRSTQTLRPRTADGSLADRFNLASLNGGKNPFETASERLLRAPVKKAKNDAELRDVYSLDYLLGKKTVKTAAEKTPENPFDVASAKLM